MGKVYRKQQIEGVTVPAVIHNRQYFWLNMAVYEDGTVSCWEKTDLCDIMRQLERGWLTFEIPEGESLSVHGLCTLEIISAEWNFDKESYRKFIENTVRSINHEMANIYETTQREKDKWQGKPCTRFVPHAPAGRFLLARPNKSFFVKVRQYHIGFSAFPTPFKLKENFGYETSDGRQMNIFLRQNGEIMLTSVSAFSDGTFSVDGLDGEEYISPDKIRELFNDDVLCVKPNDNETVSFGALGKARCKTIYDVLKDEKIKEIENELLRLQNKPDALETARQAYISYLIYPSEQNKEKLRSAYEAVPEHQRMYLGDMDTRDRDYIRILYTNDKREV